MSRDDGALRQQFLQDSLNRIKAGDNGRPHPLAGLVNPQTGHWKSTAPYSNEPSVNAGHTITRYANEGHFFALEDPEFNQRLNRGEHAKVRVVYVKQAVLIRGIAVERRTAEMWERTGVIPRGTVAASPITQGAPPRQLPPVYLNIPVAKSPLRRTLGNQAGIALLGQMATNGLTNWAYAGIGDEIAKQKKALEKEIRDIRSQGRGVLIIIRIKRDATGDVHGAKPRLLGVHVRPGDTHQQAMERWLDPRYNLVELATPPWVIDEQYEWISPFYPEPREARSFPQPQPPPTKRPEDPPPPVLRIEPLR
jgi:hypothetical protein